MGHFLVEYRDLADVGGREAHRGDHITFRKSLGKSLVLAGPLLGDDGSSVGSVVIFEASSRADAESIALQDPYVTQGVVELVSVRPYRIASIKPPAP